MTSAELLPYELALVMPVYNEEACISSVVRSWFDELLNNNINFKMIVLDDGSVDNTAVVLEQFKANPRIDIIRKENNGHGPTILKGYRFAADIASWVFQTDSDDEIQPCHFSNLWAKRGSYDALFGVRRDRSQTISHRLISKVSRWLIYSLLGTAVEDVNVPYRLIRGPLMREIIGSIPLNTFAPNIIISGVLAKKNLRIYNYPVPCEGRRTGRSSIVNWKLFKYALKSLLQTILYTRITMKKK